MDRVYNFNAGPSAMPLEVLQEAQAEFLNYKNTGMSIIEMSHRSPEYAAMHAETKALLRQLMEIPDDYEILFIQGGGSLQFLMTAANFFTNKRAAYANTGVWAKKSHGGSQTLRRSLRSLHKRRQKPQLYSAGTYN